MKLSIWKSCRQTSSWCSQTWCQHSLTNTEMERRAFSVCWFQTLCLPASRTFTVEIWLCRAQIPQNWNGAALGDALASTDWAKVQNCKAPSSCCHSVHCSCPYFLYCFKTLLCVHLWGQKVLHKLIVRKPRQSCGGRKSAGIEKRLMSPLDSFLPSNSV